MADDKAQAGSGSAAASEPAVQAPAVVAPTDLAPPELAPEQTNAVLAKVTTDMIPADQLAGLTQQGDALADKLASNPGDLGALSVAESIGTAAESAASGFLTARPVTDLRRLQAGGPGSTLPQQMSRLRVAADRLNPQSIRRTGLAGFLREVGLDSWADSIADHVLKGKYEHIGSIMDAIKGVVHDMLATQTHVIESNTELEALDKSCQDQTVTVRKVLVVLKEAALAIKKKLDGASDADKIFLTKLLNQVMIRMQYVLLTENMLQQYRVMVTAIHDANRPIIDALGGVAHVVEVTVPMGATAMIIADEQSQAIGVAKQGMDLAVGTLESAAAATSESVKGAASLAGGELVPMERIQKAHDDIIAAATQLQQAYEAGNKRVEEQMPVFEHMNDTLQPFLGNKAAPTLSDQDPLAATK